MGFKRGEERDFEEKNIPIKLGLQKRRVFVKNLYGGDEPHFGESGPLICTDEAA